MGEAGEQGLAGADYTGTPDFRPALSKAGLLQLSEDITLPGFLLNPEKKIGWARG